MVKSYPQRLARALALTLTIFVTCSGSAQSLQETGDTRYASSRRILSRPQRTLTSSPDPSNCIVTEKIVQYTVERINKTKITKLPFPHLYVTEVFEPSFYSCLLQNIPANTAKATKAVYSKIYKKSQRYGMTLASSHGAGVLGLAKDKEIWLPVSQRHVGDLMNLEFWQEFGRRFGGQGLRDAFLMKFRKQIAKRGVSLEDALSDSYMGLDLSRDRHGYSVGPHTDDPSKLVSTVFYLPKDLSLSKAGTMIVESKSGRGQQESTWEDMKNSDFQIVKQAEFAPNALFAFAPCLTSWHAVSETTVEKLSRDTIQGFVGSSAGKVPKKEC